MECRPTWLQRLLSPVVTRRASGSTHMLGLDQVPSPPSPRRSKPSRRLGGRRLGAREELWLETGGERGRSGLNCDRFLSLDIQLTMGAPRTLWAAPSANSPTSPRREEVAGRADPIHRSPP